MDVISKSDLRDAEILSEIINHCILLDTKAAAIYEKLAGLAETAELKRFWKDMSEAEKRHVSYWEELLDLSRECAIPQIFEDPCKVKKELESIQIKVDGLNERSKKSPNVHNAFVLAYRLEFYLLHPAFSQLLGFHFNVKNDETAVEDYDNHLKDFIVALNEYCEITPELDMIAETIEKLWKENKKLFIQSNIDELTGIFNRRGLFQVIVPLSYMAQRNDSYVGIMMIDVDDFKNINDLHGHQAGDGILKLVADIIRSTVRKSDITGRYGGEEFLVFSSPLEPDSFLLVADRIRRRVERETGEDIPASVSIGGSYASFGENIEAELKAIIRRADDNLYQAKAKGKNRVVIS